MKKVILPNILHMQKNLDNRKNKFLPKFILVFNLENKHVYVEIIFEGINIHMQIPSVIIISNNDVCF